MFLKKTHKFYARFLQRLSLCILFILFIRVLTVIIWKMDFMVIAKLDRADFAIYGPESNVSNSKKNKTLKHKAEKASNHFE